MVFLLDFLIHRYIQHTLLYYALTLTIDTVHDTIHTDEVIKNRGVKIGITCSRKIIDGI